MTTNLRLVIPGLFEAHMLKTLVSDTKLLHQQLLSKLKRADQSEQDYSDIYQALYQLTPAHRQYVPWLIPSELVDGRIAFRADPVILQPTHNGILCRGNDILHLDPDEQRDLEATFNDYFSERGIELAFYSPSQAVVLIDSNNAELAQVEFSSLAEVLGQDLTHHLPKGDAGSEWQAILMETQMLLHRTETNQNRSETGEKTVGSLWFWGNNHTPEASLSLSVDTLFTDNDLLKQVFSDKAHDLSSFNEVLSANGSVDIVIEQCELACLQNDPQRWQNAFDSVTREWILPAIEALQNKSIAQLEIVTETAQYIYNPWHSMRFWR